MPFNGTWITKTALTTPRFSPAAAVANGKLYAFGGIVSTGPSTSAPSASVEVYDPVANTWAPAAPMPAARVPRGGDRGRMIYAIGGNAAGGGLPRWSSATIRWATHLARACAMPAARGFLAAAVVRRHHLCRRR
jgi:hypothetical protein